MRGASGFWVALLGLALGPVAGEIAGVESTDDLLEFLEFLGDEDIAGDAWNGFFDSLPEHPDDASPLVMVPVVTEEAIP